MITDEISMMQLSDSMFPAGMFATSNGIESLFSDGRITSAADLEGFIGTSITQQVGPCDAVALACAHGSAERGDIRGIREVDSAYISFRNVREARRASVRSGMQLVRCIRGFCDAPVLKSYCDDMDGDKGGVSGAYPVSLGVCCGALGMDRTRSAAVLLYGFAASSVGAALRLGIIHHLEGQRILHRLGPLIGRASQENSAKSAGQMWQFAPQIEISQMLHEGRDSNMFVT